MSSFLTRLEVIYRLDDLDDVSRVADVVCNVIKRLISHRALVERLLVDRCGVDALHLLFELADRKALLCL